MGLGILYSRIIFGLGCWYIFVVGLAWVGLNFNLGFIVIGWVAGSWLFGLGCLDLKLNGIGPICFWSRTSLHSLSLSPAGSVHGRKLYRFPSLNLALSLLIDLLRLTFKAYRQNFGKGGMALQLNLELIMFGHVWTCVFLR